LFKSDLRYRLEQNRKYILKIPTSDFPQKLSDNRVFLDFTKEKNIYFTYSKAGIPVISLPKISK